MNTTITQIPAPTVTDWGFFGSLDKHAQAAWPIAMTAISQATGQPLESVRAFLDSRHPALDGLDDWTGDRQGLRHPARLALSHRLRDSLRDR